LSAFLARVAAPGLLHHRVRSALPLLVDNERAIAGAAFHCGSLPCLQLARRLFTEGARVGVEPVRRAVLGLAAAGDRVRLLTVPSRRGRLDWWRSSPFALQR